MLIANSIRYDWGHHFSFENELGIKIDSLEIFIGEAATMIHNQSESSTSFEGNINVPQEGYPHEVLLNIFSNGNTLRLKADSFDCYNCDGSHMYIIKNSGAEYRFLN